MNLERALAALSAVFAGAVLSGGVWAANPSLVVDLATDTEAYRLDGRNINDSFGGAAASCDLNGDGVADLAVAAYYGNGPARSRPGCGEVFVIFGRRGSWRGPEVASQPDVWFYGADLYDTAGFGLSCTDLNGDGLGDLLISAPGADGPTEERSAAGALYVVYGRQQFPSEVDLETSADVIVHGESSGDQVADFRRVAVGDLNGDGWPDLAVSSAPARSRSGLATYAGRIYLLRRGPSWPTEIDLAAGADTIIYGQEHLDAVGGHLTIGDFDEDGTADLIAGVSGGDGQGSGRLESGEVCVFRGRSSWPGRIDLAIRNPDTTVFGVDTLDRYGTGVLLADLDADGHPELVSGADLANGRNDAASDAGEVRLYEPWPNFPSTADLRVSTRSVIYGAETDDQMPGAMVIGRFAGVEIDDLAIGVGPGEGPGDTRAPYCGEIYRFRGRSDFPSELGADLHEEDWIIYGRHAWDGLGLVAAADVNGDGIDEIVASGRVGNVDLPSSVFLISPLDLDGDGIPQLRDVCPLVFDPVQADSDADGRGDVCATDWDADGAPDVKDCAPSDRHGGTPPEVEGLRYVSGSTAVMTWNTTPLADRYDVSRGLLPRASASDYGACLNAGDPDLSDIQFSDPELPPPAGAFFYLVRGQNVLCSTAGTWGTTSSGTERVNENSAACAPGGGAYPSDR